MSSTDLINRAVFAWQHNSYKSVMLPALGATTCASLREELIALIEDVAALRAELEAVKREAPTHRHKKRGTEYALVGIGKMQCDWWEIAGGVIRYPVDMREVVIYRSLADGSLWVRPREEFEDGRFEEMPTRAFMEKHG